MSLFVPPRRFDPAVPEMMDRPALDCALRQADLQILERLNHFLGAHRLVLREFGRLLGNFINHNNAPLTVLDLATGAADIPRTIVRWARRRRIAITITAVDGNADTLAIARNWCAAFPEITCVQHDLRALPFADGSFDVVLCSLALHHFSASDVIEILRRVHHIARVSYFVSDLRRNRIAMGLAKLMAATLITNPLARFDAPASCERAFTPAELQTLARAAGLDGVRIRRAPVFRLVLAQHK